jgi:adenosylcobinamide-GDP ribazoletransferase
MTQFLLAFQFLTIVPIHMSGALREKDLAGSMRYYPLVGAVIGQVGAGTYILLTRCVGNPAAIVSAVVVLIGLSRALHLEGFADICDGFYAGKNKERILAIMKDSHAGPMAVIGVTCLIVLKLAFLSAVPEDARVRSLIAAPVLARWSMVFLSAISVYARTETGTGSPYIGQIETPILATAALFTLLFSWLTLKGTGLALFAAATLVAS